MQRIASFALGCLTLVCLMIASEHRALAYVDPGSGLLVIQSAAAAVGSAAYFFRRKLRTLFSGNKTAEVVPSPQDKSPNPGTQKVA
jgi:hypothetical protein